MTTPDSINDVKNFHITFKHPVLNDPQIPDEKRCKLRKELLIEEVKEFCEAVDNGDIVGVADALCDIQYVLTGAVLEFGFGEKFKALFEEVHRSNMSKACATLQEAKDTVYSCNFECEIVE